MHILLYSIVLMLVVGLSSCKNNNATIQEDVYGSVNGEDVLIYTVEFPGKLKAKVMNYGAILVSTEVPDRNGKLGDVVLGYDSLDDYVERNRFFGAVAGRYAGRIANGIFEIDSTQYQVTVNNGPNHLHGGKQGFDKVLWQTESIEEGDNEIRIKFWHLSPDGHEGFPGNIKIQATYIFQQNGFSIEYSAETDKPTVLNLTNHSYFNLGTMKSTIYDHELWVKADRFLEIDNTSIPTGAMKSVADTPFDFRNTKEIGKDINVSDPQLIIGKGYDHSFVINDWKAGETVLAASLYHKETGRVLEVLTTEPSVHLYTGNFLDESVIGRGGQPYASRFGVCLETQHFPNSPNEKAFPSVQLNPRQQFFSRTDYRFGVK